MILSVYPYLCVSCPTQLMYLHSFQSELWNKAASHRVQTHGLTVVKGDLVRDRGEDDAMKVRTSLHDLLWLTYI